MFWLIHFHFFQLPLPLSSSSFFSLFDPGSFVPSLTSVMGGDRSSSFVEFRQGSNREVDGDLTLCDNGICDSTSLFLFYFSWFALEFIARTAGDWENLESTDDGSRRSLMGPMLYLLNWIRASRIQGPHPFLELQLVHVLNHPIGHFGGVGRSLGGSGHGGERRMSKRTSWFSGIFLKKF